MKKMINIQACLLLLAGTSTVGLPHMVIGNVAQQAVISKDMEMLEIAHNVNTQQMRALVASSGNLLNTHVSSTINPSQHIDHMSSEISKLLKEAKTKQTFAEVKELFAIKAGMNEEEQAIRNMIAGLVGGVQEIKTNLSKWGSYLTDAEKNQIKSVSDNDLAHLQCRYFQECSSN